MRKYSFLILILATLAACKKQDSGTHSSSSAPNFQSASCNIGKWTGGTPLNLKISSDFNNIPVSGGFNAFEQMGKIWNAAVSPTVTLFQVPFGATTNTGYASLSSYKDNEFGIYKSTNWYAGVSSSALAITQYYGVVRNDASLGTYIDLTEADIIFNYRDFGTQFVMDGNVMYYDVPTILLHEMGHFLGLCHESNHSSIMAPYYYSTQRTLMAWDTSKIQALYLNNQNLSAITTRAATNSISAPDGTVVKGIVELNANGLCRHYLEGKVVYEHQTDIKKVPSWYRNLPQQLK